MPSSPRIADRPRSTWTTLLTFYLGIVPGYAVHVLFSRWLGAVDYGDLSVTLSVAGLVATVALLGFDKSVLKFMALYRDAEEAPKALGFLRFATSRIALAAALFSMLGFFAIRLAESRLGIDEHPLRHAMLLVLPFAGMAFLASLLAAVGRPALSSLVLKVGVPIVSIGLGLLVLRWGQISEFDAVMIAFASHALAVAFFAAAVGPPLLRRLAGHRPAGERGVWRATSISFLATGLTTVAIQHSGLLILEALHLDEGDVGVFSAARFTAAIPLVSLAAIRTVSIPVYSQLLDAGDPRGAVQRLGHDLRLLIATGCAAPLAWWLWGRDVLSLFGAGFDSGHTALLILGAGYLLVLALGLAAPVLQVLEQHRVVYLSTLALLLSNVVLTFGLVPSYGVEGAAVAFTASILGVYGFQVFWLHQRLGIGYLTSVLKAGGEEGTSDRA